jgi:FkbM family methyltransferase
MTHWVRKLRGAARVVRTSGVRGVWQALVRNVTGLPSSREEVDEVTLVRQVLTATGRPPGLMLDVGAHYGSACTGFAALGWNVVAFEPDALNRSRLEELVRTYPKVRIDPRALSNRSATAVPFFRSDQSSGISGLSAFHRSHFDAGVVDTATLAQIIEEFGLGQIDFLKTDTEGYDRFVLDGLPWDTHAPVVIVCEFEDRKTEPLGYNFHDLARLIAKQGYRIIVSEWRPVVDYGARHQWMRFQPYPCALASPAAWGNLIATRDAALYDRLWHACDRIERRFARPNPPSEP